MRRARKYCESIACLIVKFASKMSSLHNESSDDHIHIDYCQHTLSTTIPYHRSMNQRRQRRRSKQNVQNHSISTAKQLNADGTGGTVATTNTIAADAAAAASSLQDKSVVKRGRTIDKSSDFLRWHKTKLKATCQWQWMTTTQRICLVIAIVLFASFSEVLICVAHAGDVTSLIRVTDDDEIKSNNQKFGDPASASSDSMMSRDDGGGSVGDGASSGRNNPAIYTLDKFGSSNLESNLAAVFNKVAYGTTTKRSISDTVFVPSPTTVATPQLTTFR